MGDPAVKFAPSSFEEFLAWENQQPERHEFVCGEVRAMVGASKGHNRTVRRVARRLEDHLSGSPCEVFTEDIKLRVVEDSFYPDVIVACDPTDREDEYVVAHPKLVIEVLSPSTAAYDLSVKLQSYRSIPTLEQALFLDREQSRAVLLRRDASGWRILDLARQDMLSLQSIEFSVPLEELMAAT
jgi:Uma2 family endonuclease